MKLPLHRLMLVCAAAGVVLYSIAVVGFVVTDRDLGIRCLFLNRNNGALPEGIEVRRLEPHFRTWQGHYDLRVGDIVVAIAGEPVKSFSHFNHAQMALRNRLVDPEGTLLPGQTPPESGRPLVEVQSTDSSTRSRWVRVDFFRPDQAESGTLTAYCELRNLPLNRTLLLSLVWLLLEMSLFGIGALVYWKRPSDDSARLFFTMCLFTVAAFVGGYHWPVLAGSTWLIFPFALCAMLVPPVSLHFYLLFPRRKGFFYRYRWQTLAVIYTAPVVWTLVLLFLMRRVDWLYQHDRPVAQINAALGYLRTGIYSYLVVAAAQFLASVVSLAHSYVTSRKRVERNQVRWILVAAMLATVPVGYTLYLALNDRAGFALGDSTLPMFLSSVLFILAYAVGITRYKLMQLEQLINRGMMYFAISLAATAVYCATVGIGAIAFSSYLGWVHLTRQALGVAVTAMVLAAVFGMLRDRFLRVLDRRLYDEKRQLDTALRRMSQAISNLVEPHTLAERMLEAAGDVLGVRRGALYLQEDDQGPYRQIAVLGERRSPEVLAADTPLVGQLAHRSMVGVHRLGESMPTPAQQQLRRLGYELAHRLGQEGAPCGFVLFGPKRHAEDYGTEDIAFLAALSRITTLALQSAAGHHTIDELNRELHGKVEKIAEQQRRIVALQSELMRQQPAVDDTAAGPLWREEIRGSGPAVERMLSTVRKVAQSRSSVLIRGESGTGKELLARAIHHNSSRADGPFVQVHCAALSSNLLESELFGHVKGAFTGAYRDKVGRFELADGGSLFLDEIGDISLETQTKLLRVLQEMAFERVGGTETLKVDVRLIAATNQDLERLIAAGRFREDLFYRLNVISIQTPPLRERKEDIFELALHFLTVYGPETGKRVTGISDAALEALGRYSWPGNIRELENVIERAVVMTDGETIAVEDLPEEVIQPARTEAPSRPLAVGATAVVEEHAAAHARRRGPLQRAVLSGELNGYERRRLVDALAESQGNKSEAARALGLPRSTFFSKLKKYGLT